MAVPAMAKLKGGATNLKVGVGGGNVLEGGASRVNGKNTNI